MPIIDDVLVKSCPRALTGAGTGELVTRRIALGGGGTQEVPTFDPYLVGIGGHLDSGMDVLIAVSLEAASAFVRVCGGPLRAQCRPDADDPDYVLIAITGPTAQACVRVPAATVPVGGGSVSVMLTEPGADFPPATSAKDQFKLGLRIAGANWAAAEGRGRVMMGRAFGQTYAAFTLNVG